MDGPNLPTLFLEETVTKENTKDYPNAYINV